MIFATVGLVALAYIAYRTATPGNGQLLISGILGILALLAFLSISKLDWQDQQAETYRSIFNDIRNRFPVSVRFSSGNGPARQFFHTGPANREASPTFPVNIGVAEPEVHSVCSDTLEEAKRLAAEGASIDDICRIIDNDHDRHDPVHQEAFRRVVQVMIEQG